MAIFGHFLAHFGLYNYIGERPAEPHTPSRVYGHIFWTAQPIFKMLGILERADQGLSGSIKKKQNWKKSQYPPYGLNREIRGSKIRKTAIKQLKSLQIISNLVKTY